MQARTELKESGVEGRDELGKAMSFAFPKTSIILHRKLVIAFRAG
jgi:hypothetical protein